MIRLSALVALTAVLCVASGLRAAEISGRYLEARTCQVYTGPCFANSEMGLTGQDAIMAWSIDEGRHNGVDLTGLKVVVVVRGDDTLGFKGLDDGRTIKSVILIDEKATGQKRDALIEFAKSQTGRAGKAVVSVQAAPIDMDLDTSELKGRLTAGKDVKLVTRKARETDCICSNEVAFYPPLAKLEHFVPGVAEEADFKGRGLGTRWSIPNSRSVYMATFAH